LFKINEANFNKESHNKNVCVFITSLMLIGGGRVVLGLWLSFATNSEWQESLEEFFWLICYAFSRIQGMLNQFC
jgi:hypothetical protein